MTCRYCNKPLGFLQRVSGQHYCSAAHQKAHVQEQEQAAIDRLRHIMAPAPQSEVKAGGEVRPAETEQHPAPVVASEHPDVPVKSIEPEPPKSSVTPLPAPPLQKPVTPAPAAGQALPNTDEIPLPAFLKKNRKREGLKTRKPIDRASIEDLDDVPLPAFLIRGAKAKARGGPDEPGTEALTPVAGVTAGASGPNLEDGTSHSATDEIQVPASVSKKRRALDAAKPIPIEPTVEAQATEGQTQDPVVVLASEAAATEPAEIHAVTETAAALAVPSVAESALSVTEAGPLVAAATPSLEEPAPLVAEGEAIDGAMVASGPSIVQPAEPEPEFDRCVLPQLSPLAWEAPSAAPPGEAVAWSGTKLTPALFEKGAVILPLALLSPAGIALDPPSEPAMTLQPALSAFRIGSVRPLGTSSAVQEQPANMALLVPMGPDVEPLLQAPQQAIYLPHVREGRPMPVALEPSFGTTEAAIAHGAWRAAAVKHLRMEPATPVSSGEVAGLDMAGPLQMEIPCQMMPAVMAEPPGIMRGSLDTRTPSSEIAAIPANPELSAVGWLPLQASAAQPEAAAAAESGAPRCAAPQPLVASATELAEPDPRALSAMFARPEHHPAVFQPEALTVEGTAEPRRDAWTSFGLPPCHLPDMTLEPVPVQLALEVTAEAPVPIRPMRSRFRKPVPLHLSGRDVVSLPKLTPVGCDFRSAPLARANLS